MAEQRTLDQIHDALTRTYFGEAGDFVDVSNSEEGGVHVVIVSRKFKGKRLREKHDLIRSLLTQSLPEEVWGQVSLWTGVTPEEIKSI
jgi:stress-induced morphogen